MSQRETGPSAIRAAIDQEQPYVTRAYERLDHDQDEARDAHAHIIRQRASGPPRARMERDMWAAHWEDQLARLKAVEDRLVFGRIDTEEDKTYHIGRIGLADADLTPVLIDWRAPVAAAFYQATGTHSQGVIRRRHIQTRHRTVTAVDDELLSNDAAATAGLQLTGEGALLAALSQARTGRMSDIVSTIQAEQDVIIRDDDARILVVQGGPGTGKTAVALHRAAYLLYANRERLAHSGVLIIGPSAQFLSYIDQVLPSLGEANVVSLTMANLLPEVSARASDPPALAAIKGKAMWARILRDAVRDLQQIPTRAIRVRISGKNVVLTPEDFRAARTQARQSRLPHNQARSTYATALVEKLTERYAEQLRQPASTDWVMADVRDARDAKIAINVHWMPTAPEALLRRLFSAPQWLARLAPELNAEQIAMLTRERSAAWTTSDIPLLDELWDLLGPVPDAAQRAREAAQAAEERERLDYARSAISGMGLGQAMINAEQLAASVEHTGPATSLASRAASDRTWVYGHVIVDEAQEISPMGWRAITRRCPSLSMTVVGDLDQRRVGAPRGGWSDLLATHREHLSEAVLTISYRTPKTIVDAATDVLRRCGAPAQYPVQSARDLPDALRATVAPRNELAARAASYASTYLREENEAMVAIIAPPSLLPELTEQATERALNANPRLVITDPATAKGLEWDRVIIVDPAAITTAGLGDIYVAMTRPTRDLTMIISHDAATLPDGGTWADLARREPSASHSASTDAH